MQLLCPRIPPLIGPPQQLSSVNHRRSVGGRAPRARVYRCEYPGAPLFRPAQMASFFVNAPDRCKFRIQNHRSNSLPSKRTPMSTIA